MIRVEINLISAIHSSRDKKLGELVMTNDGTGDNFSASYDGKIMRKPDFRRVTREGRVRDHARENQTVWHLVCKMLMDMGYGQ